MNIQQINYFLSVCEKGSFSKAAASLGVTLQALSISMSKLESELGVTLFNRTGRGTVLTEHGKYLQPHANQVIHEISTVEDHFNSLRNDSKELKVSVCAGTISEIGISLFSRFRAANPEIDLHLREFKDVLVDNELARERCEVGIGLEPIDSTVYDCARVFRQPLVLLMREDHPLASLDRVPVGAIIDYPFIVVDEMFKSSDNFLDAAKNRGIYIEPAFRVGEVATVHRMVQRGEGIGLTVKTVAEGYSTPGTVYRMFDDYCDEFYWTLAVFKKHSASLSSAARSFYDYCVQYGKSNLL